MQIERALFIAGIGLFYGCLLVGLIGDEMGFDGFAALMLTAACFSNFTIVGIMMVFNAWRKGQ